MQHMWWPSLDFGRMWMLGSLLPMKWAFLLFSDGGRSNKPVVSLYFSGSRKRISSSADSSTVLICIFFELIQIPFELLRKQVKVSVCLLLRPLFLLPSIGDVDSYSMNTLFASRFLLSNVFGLKKKKSFHAAVIKSNHALLLSLTTP